MLFELCADVANAFDDARFSFSHCVIELRETLFLLGLRACAELLDALGVVRARDCLALERTDLDRQSGRCGAARLRSGGGVAAWPMATLAQAVSSTLTDLSGSCRPEM